MSILKADFSAEGYKLGLKDATNGDKPNKKSVAFHWEMFKKGFRLLNHNQAMKTFAKGYETGFVDGLRKREGLYGNKQEVNLSNNKTNTTMGSNPENLQKQIELLHSFENFLSNIQANLNQVKATYGNTINELYESGLVSEYVKKLKEDNFESFRTNVSKTNQWIDERDKVYAKKVIGQVEETISNIK